VYYLGIKDSLKSFKHDFFSILEASIKITNEPPTGMQANLHKALDNFDQVKNCDCCGSIIDFEIP
jgi:hypothetical protein